MPLGMKVGLDPCHIVLDGDPAPQRGTALQFLANVYYGQMVAISAAAEHLLVLIK